MLKKGVRSPIEQERASEDILGCVLNNIGTLIAKLRYDIPNTISFELNVNIFRKLCLKSIIIVVFLPSEQDTPTEC